MPELLTSASPSNRGDASRNVASPPTRLSSDPQIIFASSQITSPTSRSDKSSSSTPRKSDAIPRAAGALIRRVSDPEGSPLNVRCAVSTVSVGDASVAPSPRTKNIFSRTSEMESWSAFEIAASGTGHPQNGLQALAESLGDEWLSDVTVSAEGRQPVHAVAGRVGRDDHHRNRANQLVAFETLQKVLAIHHRHIDIG